MMEKEEAEKMLENMIKFCMMECWTPGGKRVTRADLQRVLNSDDQ